MLAACFHSVPFSLFPLARLAGFLFLDSKTGVVASLRSQWLVSQATLKASPTSD